MTKLEAHWNTQKTQIYSDATIAVEEVLRGNEIGNQVVIRHLGGEVEDLGQMVSHEPQFTSGERVKIYLKLCEDGKFSVIAGNRGKISLSYQNVEREEIRKNQIINMKTAASLSTSQVYYAYTGIHWSDSSLPVQYYINEKGTPGCTREFEAVQRSFQTWEDDPGSYIDYTYMGKTTRQGGIKDGYNVVSWGSLPEGIHAHTTCWYNITTFHLTEFDIVFNNYDTWSTTGARGKIDVQAVCTHEIGHTLNLQDLYAPECSEQTMYGYGNAGETFQRTLEAGDIAGVRFIYPISTSSATIYPKADAYVDSEHPTSNYGATEYLDVRNAYDSAYRISYLKFNLASIPSEVTLQSAVLQVYSWYLYPFPNKIGVHYSNNTTWSESEITWNNRPSYKSTSESTQTIEKANYWYTWDITTIVQTSNIELTIILSTEETKYLFGTSFSSINNSTSNKPRLNIIYAYS